MKKENYDSAVELRGGDPPQNKDRTGNPDNNPAALNLCWPLDGKEQEECIDNFEDAIEEKREEPRE